MPQNKYINYYDGRVLVADGHCFTKKNSISDYVYTKYPYYQSDTYFKPLIKASDHANDKISFDGTSITNLYFART